MTSRETEKDDVAAAGVSSTDQNENVDKHPWPYLSSLFSFCSVAANTYRFKCLLCTPKVTECSAYRNSPSNLKKHIERMHPARLEDYGKLAAGARKRMAGGSEDSPSKKKLKQPSIGALLSNANMVTQAAVDDAIANFVIGTLQPLRVVGHPDFIALIATLQPNRKSYVSTDTAQAYSRGSERDETEAGENFGRPGYRCHHNRLLVCLRQVVHWRDGSLDRRRYLGLKVGVSGAPPSQRKSHI